MSGLLQETRGTVRLLRFDNPARRNALSPALRMRPWCRDVRTTRATSGPGLTRATANTAARVSKTDNSCMATPRKRDRKGKRDSALAQARRR